MHIQKLAHRLDGEKGMDMNAIVGTENAGFEIIEAMGTGASQGYCIGRTKHEYVTWWYTLPGEGLKAHFYHGHYFPIDPDSPFKSAAKVKADYCHRLAEAYEQMSRYGY